MSIEIACFAFFIYTKNVICEFWETAMKKKASKEFKFYYSRRKLAMYLLFNLFLLIMALLFTLSIFPDYPLVYHFAIFTTALSIFSVLIVLLLHKPLAIITSQSITIDRCPPLFWKDVISTSIRTIGKGFWKKDIIIFNVHNFKTYKLNLIQKAIKNSDFTAFSIPLYAMDRQDARTINQTIHKYLKSKQH